MKTPVHLIPAIKNLVHELVVGNYSQLERDGRAGRLTAEELRRAITQYGRTLVDPPDDALVTAHVYPIGDQLTASWDVDLDLWTLEEGHSDLTLSMSFRTSLEGLQVRINDLHVL